MEWAVAGVMAPAARERAAVAETVQEAAGRARVFSDKVVAVVRVLGVTTVEVEAVRAPEAAGRARVFSDKVVAVVRVLGAKTVEVEAVRAPEAKMGVARAHGLVATTS